MTESRQGPMTADIAAREHPATEAKPDRRKAEIAETPRTDGRTEGTHGTGAPSGPHTFASPLLPSEEAQ